MNKKSMQKGFTLIELLFATAILGFMLTITLVTFIGVFRFYTWSGVTRTNQAAARETIDTIVRTVQSGEIVSTSNDSVCVVTDVSKNTVSRISLRGQSVVSETFTNSEDTNCGEGDLLASKVISSPKVVIKSLVFTQVDGSFGRVELDPSTVQKSVIIGLTTLNGIPQQGSNPPQCAPADNFCDESSYTTAVNSGR